MRTVASDEAPPADVVDAAVDALASGAVVGLPTETVYGLGVRADRAESLARLAEVKGSDDGRPFTLHVGGSHRTAGARLPAVVARLEDRYWPGPLTLVLRADSDTGAFPGLEALSRDGWTGVRAPAHAVTAAVLDAAPFPVVMSSANLAGGAPALDAGALRGTFDEDAVALVVDSGRSSLGESSTVLAVGPGRFEVLREGIVTADELRRAAGLSLLFVCTGNTCRSPMAEALARAALRGALDSDDEGSFGFSVASAGVVAGPGAPASKNSVAAIAEVGLDLSGHASRPAIDRDVQEADRVYCLTASHRDALLAMLPPSAAASVELLDPLGGDVPDPFGGPLEVYRATRDAITDCVRARLRDWV